MYTAAEISDSVHEIADIRDHYVRERLAFVPGQRMEGILLGLGATQEDLDALRIVQ